MCQTESVGQTSQSYIDCSHFKKNKWALRGISCIRMSNLSTWPSLSGSVGREDVESERAGHPFVIIRWALSLEASSAQYLGQAGRRGWNDIPLFLSVPLRLLQFKPWNSPKIYDNSSIVSLALLHLAYFSLSFSHIFLHVLFLS